MGNPTFDLLKSNKDQLQAVQVKVLKIFLLWDILLRDAPEMLILCSSFEKQHDSGWTHLDQWKSNLCPSRFYHTVNIRIISTITTPVAPLSILFYNTLPVTATMYSAPSTTDDISTWKHLHFLLPVGCWYGYWFWADNLFTHSKIIEE